METCIIFIEGKNYAYLALEGFIETEKIKEFAGKLIDLCSKKKVTRLLFDTSKLSIIKPSDLEWVINEILPNLRFKHIEKIAFLLPENPFGFVSVRNLMKHIDNKKVEVFRRMEHAETWIFEQENTDFSLSLEVRRN